MKNGFHHLHLRKRIYKNLEPYPHGDVFKKFFDKLMYVVALLVPLIPLPQVWEVLVNKNVQGVAVSSWFFFGVVDILWLIYGFIHKEPPIYISNFIITILNFVVVIGVLLYR